MNQSRASSPKILLFGVAGCFLLSGFAALLYQMAWMRQFSTVFGTSEIAVATVLSAYMGGLALGAAISGRLVQLIKKPVLFYGLLEAAIAGSALLVPLALSIAAWLYGAVLGGQDSLPNAEGLGQPLFYFFVAFTVLAIPTACMGATLPVLTRYVVTRDDQIGGRVGGLYAINTIGAVGGALIAGFVLLPRLGLQGTIWCGVAVNLLVFVLAVLVDKSSSGALAEATETQDMLNAEEVPEVTDAGPAMNYAWLILPIMTVSGLCTFVYEVLWTRLLSHILGGSVAAFAIMLGSFLTGIALGSLVASRIARTRSQAATAFVVSQLGIAITSISIYYALNQYISADIEYQSKVILAFLVLMPATLFIGATFPLAVRVYASGASSAARSSARVYSWNTLGAILGAAIAGFFLVPLLKYEGAIRTMVLLNAGLATLVAITLVSKSRLAILVSALFFLSVAFVYQPKRPENVLRYSPIAAIAEGEILYYDVGRSSTVLMYEEEGSFMLRNNGLPEAGALPLGAPNALENQRLLGALPVLARPDVKSALIVGLGAGSAVTGIPPTVEDIDVIELEPKVIEANLLITDRRKYQPLQDPRVSVVINDARSALALTSKKYDMVVSQPSHPWSAGASHLYTREYMQMVTEHLNDDGVYLQWINSQFLDESLLKSLCATILDVFPNVRIYQWSPQVLFFLASDEPMDIERQILETGRPFSDAPLFYLELGVSAVEDTVAALMMDEQGVRSFAEGAQVITDDFNMMAMESARLTQEGRELSVQKLADIFRPWVPALNPNSWVHQELGNALVFTRIAEKFATLSTRQYSSELVLTLSQANNPNALLLAGILLRSQTGGERAEETVSAALVAMPSSNYAKYAVVEPWLRFLGSETLEDQIPEHIPQIIETMTGISRVVVDAAAALTRRDLQRVADLDVQLSSANTADPWFAEAVKLRVDWRNAVSNPGLQERFTDQAWRILDLAMANKNDQDFFAMRVVSAAQAGRGNEMMEGARAYIKVVDFQLVAAEEGYISPETAELDLKLSQINAISRLVVENDQTDQIDPSTKAEIQTGLAELVERMQKLMLSPQ